MQATPKYIKICILKERLLTKTHLTIQYSKDLTSPVIPGALASLKNLMYFYSLELH